MTHKTHATLSVGLAGDWGKNCFVLLLMAAVHLWTGAGVSPRLEPQYQVVRTTGILSCLAAIRGGNFRAV